MGQAITVTALMHDAFRASLQFYIDGDNDAERSLAELALNIYDLVADEESVIEFVNQLTLQTLETTDES